MLTARCCRSWWTVDVVSQALILVSSETAAVGSSVGYAWYSRDGDNLREILDVADQVMYTCKTSGLMPLA
jgi:GGDEF domain-containing protein